MIHYTPAAEDQARMERLLRRYELLRRECPCIQARLGEVCAGCAYDWPHEHPCPSACLRCHGLGYAAPPPETWCGLLAGLWLAQHEALDQLIMTRYRHQITGETVYEVALYSAPRLESALLKALEAAAGEPQAQQ